MLLERRAFDRVYGDDEDLELGGLDERLQLVGLTASQSCRSSALCRREVGGVLERGAQLQAAVRRRYSYRRASRRGLEQHKSWNLRRPLQAGAVSGETRLKPLSSLDELPAAKWTEKACQSAMAGYCAYTSRGGCDLSRPCLPSIPLLRHFG
jgi:hypothetical protein